MNSPKQPAWFSGEQASSICTLRGHFVGLTLNSPGSLTDDLLLLLRLYNKRTGKQIRSSFLSGPRGIRTLGLLNAIEARSQLRYGPNLCSRLVKSAVCGMLWGCQPPVDLRGFEPLTSSVRLKRAPSCATGPFSRVTVFYFEAGSMSRTALFGHMPIQRPALWSGLGV